MTTQFKRNFKRAKVNLPATVIFGGAKDELTVRCLGGGGLFLLTPDPDFLGPLVKLEILFPKNVKVRALAEVVWQRTGDKSTHLEPGAGMKFINLSERQLDFITQFVDTIPNLDQTYP